VGKRGLNVSEKTDHAGQHFQACSHYCERKKAKRYLPHQDEPGLRLDRRNYIKNVLRKTKAGAFALGILKWLFHVWRWRYFPNNNLGIFISTGCNLSCFNCQTSARQAPANDIMTVGQLETIVSEAIDLKYYWNAIILTGGEPTLHPQLFELLEVLKKYKNFNPGCQFRLETNGAGGPTQAVLKKIPDWIAVCNSEKKEGKDDYAFLTYQVAPVDMPADRSADFSKGCFVLSECYGLCATMFGYYPCSPCMNVARVFGSDIGIQKLSKVTEKALRGQMKILCQYCGFFKRGLEERVLAEKVSRSWKKAFEEYGKQKPVLSLYPAIENSPGRAEISSREDPRR